MTTTMTTSSAEEPAVGSSSSSSKDKKMGNSAVNGRDSGSVPAAASPVLLSGLLNEAIHKVGEEILPRIEGHVSGHDAASELDFLRVKNETMITYLIELVANLRREAINSSASASAAGRGSGESEGDGELTSETSVGNGNGNGLMRLMEIKAVLDKSRNLEQKLRYQIDKLLVAADAHGEVDGEGEGGDPAAKGFAVRNSNSGTDGNDDPLEYRPNVGALLGEDDSDGSESAPTNDEGEDRQESSDDDDDDGEDDEEIAAARRTLALAGKDGKGGQARHERDASKGKDRRRGTPGASSRDSGEEDEARQLYRAPRLASVPYAGDVVDRQAERAKRERQRLRAGEIATALRSRYSDAPDVEDVHGGADLGRQRETSRKWAQKQHEKTQYEEANMVRLADTRKDKKFQKRLMRQEMSNLSAIADLGSLVVRGLGNGGRGGGSDDDEDGRGRRSKARQGRSNDDRDDGQRFSNGKRRRSGDGGNSSNSKKDRASGGFQSSNALQAALYGGGRDGGGKKKKKGGRK